MKNSSLKSLVFVAAIAALAVLMATAQLPSQSHLAQTLQDSTHIIVAGTIALLFLRLFKGIPAIRHSRINGFAVAFALTMAITVAAEGAQSIAGRPFEWGDILLNLAGAVAALLWVAPSSLAKKTIASIIFLAALSPTLLWLSAYAGRANAFPKLIECGSHWSSRFLSTDNANIEFSQSPFTNNANSACKITLLPAAYPGIAIDEPMADWADYDLLVIPLFNPGVKTLALTVRIHDAVHNQDYIDRYNLRIEFPPGASEFRIALDEIKAAPAGRKMNLHRIAGILLFATNPEQAKTFYTGDLRLEKQTSESIFND